MPRAPRQAKQVPSSNASAEPAALPLASFGGALRLTLSLEIIASIARSEKRARGRPIIEIQGAR
jgi:hypothetical protein